MQITLNQNEIEKALINFVRNQGITIANPNNVNVTLIAGRAPNGMSASINIYNDDRPSDTPTPRSMETPEDATVIKVSEPEEDISTKTDEEIAPRPLFGA